MHVCLARVVESQQCTRSAKNVPPLKLRLSTPPVWDSLELQSRPDVLASLRTRTECACGSVLGLSTEVGHTTSITQNIKHMAGLLQQIRRTLKEELLVLQTSVVQSKSVILPSHSSFVSV